MTSAADAIIMTGTDTEILPNAVRDLRAVAHELRMCASVGDVLYWDEVGS